MKIDHPHAEVPTKTRFLWGMGGFSDAMIYNGTGSLVNVIYVNALGVNAALVNLACAIPRFLDFVTDPMVGHLSDNPRTRWGRRRQPQDVPSPVPQEDIVRQDRGEAE